MCIFESGRDAGHSKQKTKHFKVNKYQHIQSRTCCFTSLSQSCSLVLSLWRPARLAQVNYIEMVAQKPRDAKGCLSENSDILSMKEALKISVIKAVKRVVKKP